MSRSLHEVVVLTRDCDIGKAGERCVVVDLSPDKRYMTLLFVDRDAARRKVATGADYKFLRTAEDSRFG